MCPLLYGAGVCLNKTVRAARKERNIYTLHVIQIVGGACYHSKQTGFKDRQSSPAGCYMMRALIIQTDCGLDYVFGWKIRSLSSARRRRKTLPHSWCNPTIWLRANKTFVGCWTMEYYLCIINEVSQVRDRDDLVNTEQRPTQTSGHSWPETSAELTLNHISAFWSCVEQFSRHFYS